MSPGDLVMVESAAGYCPSFQYVDFAFIRHVSLPHGTHCIFLGRDDSVAFIRQQPMVKVLVGEDQLSVDERFLQVVHDASPVV